MKPDPLVGPARALADEAWERRLGPRRELRRAEPTLAWAHGHRPRPVRVPALVDAARDRLAADARQARLPAATTEAARDLGVVCHYSAHGHAARR